MLIIQFLRKATAPNLSIVIIGDIKERHLVKCFFVATRYDKLVSSFLAFVYIASIWLLSK